MHKTSREQFHAALEYQPVLRQLGLDAATVFTHPEIRVWRSLPDRENCTLDGTLGDGRAIRLHIKRYPARRTGVSPAEAEADGINLLRQRGIASVPLVAWGELADGRSCILMDDLTGYRPADKLVEEGFPFGRLLQPTAAMAAQLHEAGLHHRDLYLNHFFVKEGSDPVELRLIDCARVRPLPRLLRGRWIIKDLSQFWYSTLRLSVSDVLRTAWVEEYAARRRMAARDLRRAIERKARWIARHDARLRRKQPQRNLGIPW